MKVCRQLPFLILGMLSTLSYGAIQPELRVATRYKVDPKFFDPAVDKDAAYYDLALNLYSTLVGYNSSAQIITGVADKFYWKDSSLVFDIRPEVKSSKGNPINAQDVVNSMVRYHLLNPDRYSAVYSELCSATAPKTLDKKCPGIVADKNSIVLKFKRKRPIFVSIFANAEFSIVPGTAYDHKTLQMTDLYESSGPYKIISIKSELPTPALSLEARPDHWLWKKSIPQKVVVLSLLNPDGTSPDGKKIYEAYKDNKVDMIPTYSSSASILRKWDAPEINFDYHITEPISVYNLYFSKKAKRELSNLERIKIGLLIRAEYVKGASLNTGKYIRAKEADEFFPINSDYSLSKEQRAEYESILAQAAKVKFHRKPVLHAIESYMQDAIRAINATKEIGYINEPEYRWPPTELQQEKFDGFFGLTDASSIESVDSILGLESAGAMPFSPEENKKWIEDYINTEDKKDRIVKAKKMHLEMLKAGNVTPMSSSPYATVVRKPWKLHIASTFSANPLWQIEWTE